MSAKRIAAIFAAGAIFASVAPAAAAVPNTSITSGPTGLIAKRSATFRFSSTVRSATFQCRLDDKAWKSCESPKSYSLLRQGAHKFKVRARKAGVVDPTPAVRAFTVDTVKPNTTILSGPIGEIEDHSPSFTFSSTEAGTFECKLTSSAFTLCSSPFVLATPLIDGSYTFKVRARDAAGNADATPASRAFNVETPLTMDQETAEAAAELYFPDAAVFDVPATCGGSTSIDCPDGTPVPPADQVSTTSTRTVTEVVGANRYDIIATTDVATLQAIKVLVPLGPNCDLTVTSANGDSPTWTFTMSLHFVTDPTTGELRIERGDLGITGAEEDDFELLGGYACQLANLGIGFIIDTFVDSFSDYFMDVGYALCAAPGPAYLGPCPEPSP
jgi:hypothetical protein